MNKMRLAQALVPIADELDERGLEEEANELDEIIQELMSEASQNPEMVKQAAMYDSWGKPKFAPVQGQPTTQWNPNNPVIGQPAPQWNANKPVSSTMGLQDQMAQVKNGPRGGNWENGPQAPGNIESTQLQWANPQQQQNVANRLTQLKLQISNIDNQLMQLTGGNPDDPRWANNHQVQQLRQQKMNFMREGAQLRTQYELPANPKGSYGDYQQAYNLQPIRQQ